jgi:gliding motility-associated-like protein
MKTKALFFTLILSFFYSKAVGQCSGNEPVVFLGNDTVLCEGQSVLLQAPLGYENYLWSNGSSGTALTASNSGIYILTATILTGGTNLVVNGDFSAGSSGFTSDYVSGTGGSWGLLSDPGQFAVSTSPNLVHTNFNSCDDHSVGTGNMYVANGSDVANSVVWKQTIAVVPNTNYNFSAWVTSVETTTNPAILQFYVNDVQLGNVFSPTSSGCNWTEFYNLWFSGSNTSAVISIKNQNIDGSGNDFALDDIKFTSFCVNSDTIEVSFDAIDVSAGNDIVICDYEDATITAVSNNANATYSWTSGETVLSISPGASATYTITATSENECIDTDAVLVTINTSPAASISGTPLTGAIPLSVNFANATQNGTNYNWSFGNGSTNVVNDLSSQSAEYLTVGQYEVVLIASNLNCSDTAYLVVNATNVVSVDVPNVFSPNGDKVNDTYHLILVNVSELELEIFNRWGNLVYETTDTTASWNGLDSSGNEMSDGVYTYKYSAKGLNNELFEGQGFIHLER